MRELARGVRRATVPAEIRQDDPIGLRELRNERRPGCSRGPEAVEHHERRSVTVDLVIELDPVDLCEMPLRGERRFGPRGEARCEDARQNTEKARRPPIHVRSLLRWAGRV